MNRFEGIVEVQALSPDRVNEFLEGGYQLLSITVVHVWGRYPEHFAIRYVVGRTVDVTAIPCEKAKEEASAT